MKIEMNINEQNKIVDILEVSDNGLRRQKKLKLNEFLRLYSSTLKEKDDRTEYIYMPPGCIDYRKNVSSIEYWIHTNLYREFYGLADNDDDYLVKVKIDTLSTRVLDFDIYRTKGAFNRYMSRFTKLLDGRPFMMLGGIDVSVKKILGEGKNSLESIEQTKKKFDDIIEFI